MNHRAAACVVLLLFGFVATAFAEGSGYRVSMFDGKSLTAWQVDNCQVVIVDGAILTQAGKGIVRSNHSYSDFVLEFEARALRDDQGNGRIIFHGSPNPHGSWPTGYSLQLRSGVVKHLQTPSCDELVKPYQWNRYQLTVVGTKASLKINGKMAWQVRGVESQGGFIALQVDDESGPYLFRRLFITELNHTSIFNGRDLTGWQGVTSPAESCWRVENETILCTGEKGTWLRSDRKYGDFNLRLQYKITPGGNSGIYVRVPEDGNHHGFQAGVEIQILDDEHPRYAKLKPFQSCGSVYAVAAAQKHVGYEAGRWNTLEIDCRGNRYRVIHNGSLVVDADRDQFPRLKERLLEGFLGLQNHSERVWFRHLRVGPASFAQSRH